MSIRWCGAIKSFIQSREVFGRAMVKEISGSVYSLSPVGQRHIGLENQCAKNVIDITNASSVFPFCCEVWGREK